MGTRALTRVYDEQDRLVLYLYSQSDGYPCGLGRELHKKLGKLTLVNGIQNPEGVANGMSCFAAQLVAALKNGAGNFYIKAPNDDTGWADFIYDFRPNALGYPEHRGDKRHLCLKLTANIGHKPVVYDGPFDRFDYKEVEKVVEAAFKDD